jgi:nucleotide-binding universal stress UspA family protein
MFKFPGNPMMKIVVGYDPPHQDEKLLNRVINDARHNEAHVYLVTSLSDAGGAEGLEMDRIEEDLRQAKALLDAENISAEAHLLVRHNTPGEDIVAFAEENGADEIIIQIKKTSRVGKLIRGSNAQHIILNAHCSVVSVK